MKIVCFTLTILILFATQLHAYRAINDIAARGGEFDIPISIYLPDSGEGPFPVFFNVHGGGWNGGDEKSVPPASHTSHASFLCDRLGVIYVGLAYRCKGNNGTFRLAIEDLEASLKWFMDRADEFNADLSRIGFGGGSAGTTLSAILAQRYPGCKLYVGAEGMYDLLWHNPEESIFPTVEAMEIYGLGTREDKLFASPYYNLREKPASALLLHGKDDTMCNYIQSERYAEKIRQAGGRAKVVLYDNINHTCLSRTYPEIFERSVNEIIPLFIEEFQLKNIDTEAIKNDLKKSLENLYPVDEIATSDIIGTWSGSFGSVTFESDGTGVISGRIQKQQIPLVYINKGSFIAVSVDGEDQERTFYLRKNKMNIYELIRLNNRYKSRRNDYRLQRKRI